MAKDKIVSLVDRLKKKENKGRELQGRMDRMFQAHKILADAIETMRDEGIGDDEIVRTLECAAELLSSADS